MHAGILNPSPYRLTTLIGVIAAASLVGCGSGGEEKRESTTFEIPNDEVTISKGNGSLYIRPATVDQLEVVRRCTGHSEDAIWKISAANSPSMPIAGRSAPAIFATRSGCRPGFRHVGRSRT
ncbi:MAG: hypothetical protein ACK5MR_12280 [Cumulibacter sp.]